MGDFRTLRLIHKSPVFSFRIGTALKHIISEEVAAGRQLDISHGVNTLIGENKAVVVGAGIERGDNAAFFCQITQCVHIGFAVFVEKSLYLPCNLCIQPYYIVQKSIVQLTDFK